MKLKLTEADAALAQIPRDGDTAARVAEMMAQAELLWLEWEAGQ